MTHVLLSTRPDQVESWAPRLAHFRSELGVPFTLHLDPAAAPTEKIDMLVINPVRGVQDLTPYRNLKVIQSMWAGVEALLANPTLPEGPTLCRMVEPGLTEGMTEYIAGHVLRHHLGVDRDVRNSLAGVWKPQGPPLARDRKVGVLGLGALGADAARMLARLRFDVAGWSRTPRSIEGVTCFHGPAGLDDILARSEIIVTILPDTAETRGILNQRTLALAPRGAVVINPGRGPLIDDEALLAALESGQISHATLDVFETEPLPEGHPYWRNPQVTVTPHIAAETRPRDAARVVVEQIGRMVRGEPLLNVVDRAAGY
ncbi:glyoxylate/hydroxypyruvate reductase A [Pikeienuella sp. HZG-20]|uniref:2-hydroxyacid dehydrogenase n=1 Tax=Paludibacillus litoralis TaxID=3133267 RepID=UPI0030EC1DF2